MAARFTRSVRDRNKIKKEAGKALRECACAYVLTGSLHSDKKSMVMGIYEVNSDEDTALYHHLLYRAYTDIREKLIGKIISGEFKLPLPL